MYNGTATSLLNSGTTAPTPAADWSTWWLGSRTQWNVTKDFYLGLDVAYTRISGLSTPTGFYPSANGVAALLPGNTNLTARRLDDQDTWLARFRVHRDFYP